MTKFHVVRVCALSFALSALALEDLRAEEPTSVGAAAEEPAKPRRKARKKAKPDAATKGAAAATPTLLASPDAAAPADAPPNAVPAAGSPIDPLATAVEPPPNVLRFSDDLGVAEDMSLRGIRMTQTVDFALPRSWEVSTDPVLHLNLSHSAALLPDRSHLTVVLNGQSVKTVRLDATNMDAAEVVVPLPRRMLQDYNHVSLSVVQHHTDGCEDPFDPALWTRIARTSWLDLTHVARPVTGGLDAWPYPLVDERGYGPVRLVPVGAQAPSAATVRASGELAVTLGRFASYRGVDVAPAVTRVEDAKLAALVVGLVSEVPALEGLLGTKVELAAGEGVVGVVPNPGDASLPVLVAVGADEAGLLAAVRALASTDRQGALVGTSAVVRAASAGKPPPRTELPLRLPDGEEVTLRDLGVKSTTVRGHYAESVRVPLLIEADARVRPDGGSFDLHYAYSGQLDNRLSSVEVRLDGLSLRSVPLDVQAGAQDGFVRVMLPTEILTPQSVVEVVFHLFPRDFNACTWTSDDHIWGTVLDSSSVKLTRDHLAELPDLGLLKHAYWPYTRSGGTTVALPDAPTGAAWSAGLELVAALGRASALEDPGIALEIGRADMLGGKGQLVVLADDTAGALAEGLKARSTVDDDALRKTLRADAPSFLLDALNTAQSSSIEQIALEGERSALVLRSSVEGGLADLVDALRAQDKLAAMGGNAVVLSGEDELRVLDLAKRVTWGSLPPDVRAQAAVKEHWWTLGAILVAGAAVVSWVVRRVARRTGAA